MIRIKLAKQPKDFDTKVRQPGLSAIEELVGRSPLVRRPGRRRAAVAKTKSAIPATCFPPYWRLALDDMMQAYGARCAYLAMAIDWIGHPTVDHVIPKSFAWAQVYRWSNYRLCAGVVNSKKGELQGLVDPTKVNVGWFELDFRFCDVVRGRNAPVSEHQAIDATLPLLNIRDCLLQRQQYVKDYRLGPGSGGIDLPYLERQAPFIAAELRRQGQLVRGDV